MTFATNLNATALRLLTSYGESVSVSRNSSNTYNTTTGEVSAGITTTFTGYGYPDSYNSYDMLSNNVAANGVGAALIKVGDIKLYFSSTTQPLVNDIFTVDGKAYTALNVQRVTAQGSDILYVIQIRQ